MGHSRELLESISRIVAESWPIQDGFKFVYEQPLHNAKLRMLPDIQVLGPKGKIQCVVEIGYTRPEKLTKYRELGIPDIRWYDKSGNLHSAADVKSVIRQIRFEAAPSICFKVLYFDGVDICYDCFEERMNICACDSDDCEHDPLQPLTEARKEELAEELYGALPNATTLIVVSNGSKYLAAIFCDGCGSTAITDNFAFDRCQIYSAADFEHQARRQKSARVTLTYDEMVEFFDANYGLTVSYNDFKSWEQNKVLF